MATNRTEETRVLLVEDDQGLGELLAEEIEDAGLSCRLAYTAENALAMCELWLPEIIVSDLRLPGADGLTLLRKIRSKSSGIPPDFLMITAFGTVSKAVECLKAGAEDFLTKPLDLEHFKLAIARIIEKRKMREQIGQIRERAGKETTFHGMYGRSSSMLTLFQQIHQIADAGGPVLITGESGTGKELVARAIHRESKSTTDPFLAVNCAGIPEHLLESEFFGHEAGAFTGATKSRQGIFAETRGGTLLLDEISEMPIALQSKLLRVLQDGMIRPVGSNQEQKVDVRIVAATNRDIEELVRAKDFREDLFYRLETFQLQVPSLRDRGEDDIDLLASIFLEKYATAAEKRIKGLSDKTLEMLHSYRFPGNVRELQNSIERAVAFCHGEEIHPEHLPRRIRESCEEFQTKLRSELLPSLQVDENSLPTLKEVENLYIDHVLNQVSGNKKVAASILGIARRTLYRRLDEDHS